MKARKFLKRDRNDAGRATGAILLHLSLPVTEEVYDLHVYSFTPTLKTDFLRNFINKHLNKSPELLSDANLTIQAEIRASGGGLRRKKLAAWTFGENLESTFETAKKTWELLELEDDYKIVEVEIFNEKN